MAASRSSVRVGAVAVLIAIVVASAAGCRRHGSYSQDTPDDVVKSAVAMVKNGDANRLPDLIYADNTKMRSVLNRLGVLLGHMQELAAAIQKRFPQDVAKIKADAEKAAESGAETGGPLAALFPGGVGGRRRGGPGGGGGGGNIRVEVGSDGATAGADNGDPGAAFKRVIAEMFADPYGWIDRNAARLSTERLADDRASVTLDGKTILPPLGIPIQQDGDKWYVALPTHMPMVADYMPRSEEEWRIIASVILVLDNTVTELTGDVAGRRIGSINELADKAGEKLIAPAGFVFMSYSHEMDVRKKRERIAKQFKQRQKDWLKTAQAAADGGTGAMPERLAGAIESVSGGEIDKMSRRDRPPNIETMTDQQFAELLQGWLAGAGMTVSLGSPLKGAEIDRAIGEWESKPKLAKAETKKK